MSFAAADAQSPAWCCDRSRSLGILGCKCIEERNHDLGGQGGGLKLQVVCSGRRSKPGKCDNSSEVRLQTGPVLASTRSIGLEVETDRLMAMGATWRDLHDRRGWEERLVTERGAQGHR